MSPRKVPPDEFWVCCQIVGVTTGKRVFNISCGNPLPTNLSTCTECTHARCKRCIVWARQIFVHHHQGSKGTIGKNRLTEAGVGVAGGELKEGEGSESDSGKSGQDGRENSEEREGGFEEEGVSCR